MTHTRRVFTNDEPLTQEQAENPQSLRLDDFPTVTDFDVVIHQTGMFGGHLRFTSDTHGHLISFPWWDHVERFFRTGTRNSIPLGTTKNPFYDLEQGWQVIIFIEGKYVYLLQGGDIGDRRAAFNTWFRVPRETYITAWDVLLARCNPDYEPEPLAAFWTRWKTAREHGQHPHGAISDYNFRRG